MINEASICGTQHSTKGTPINDHLNHQSIHHEQSLTLNTVALIFLFKDKYLPHCHLQCLLQLTDYIMTSLEMENSTFTSWLDRMFSLWNTAAHHMNFWVCTAGTYRATYILGRVRADFFNYHQFNEMTHMPDEIVLARSITPLDLEFEKALHYHDEGYESDNCYGTSSRYEACTCLFSLNLWGLLQSCQLQGSTMSYLSLHTQMTQGWVTLPSRGLFMLRIW